MNYSKPEIFKRCTPAAALFLLVGSMIIATGSEVMIATPIHAQPANPFTNSLIIYLTLYGINGTTGEVFAFAKAHGVIKNSLFNATKLDIQDNKTDGIAQTSFSFGNLTLNAGEPYTVCVVSQQDVKMICATDYKTPFARAQFVDISLR